MDLNVMGRRLTVEFGRPRPAAGEQVRMAPQPWSTVDLSEQKLMQDDSVYAVANLYCDMLLGAGWRLCGPDAEKVEETFEAVTGADGFGDMLEAMAATAFTRYSVSEIVWATSGGQWMPTAYRPLDNSQTNVDLDETGSVAGVRVVTNGGISALPLTNCVVHRNRPTFAKPLGRSAFDNLSEVIKFKRRADVGLIRFVERFSAPTIIGRYAPGATKAQQTQILTALSAVQSASVGVLPEGNQVELLEAKVGGERVSSDAIAMYERRIARGVLGSVLAIFESQFGTRAQAETHLEVLKAVIRSRQAPIEETINRQLWGPVLAYNWGGMNARFELCEPDFSDLEQVGRWVADLATAGVIDPLRDGDAIRKLFGLEPMEAPEAKDVPDAEDGEAE